MCIPCRAHVRAAPMASHEGSKVLLGGEHILCEVNARLVDGCHDTGPLILAHTALKEVGLALQADHLHPVKGVLHVVQLLTTVGQANKGNQNGASVGLKPNHQRDSTPN